MSVHSVRSAKQVLDLVETLLPPERGAVVLHWFSGSVSEARRAIDLGCYFSVNERMCQSSKMAGLLEAIPQDRLLTETDGPFVERDGLPVIPGDVDPTLIALGKILSLPPGEVSQLVRQNLYTLLA